MNFKKFALTPAILLSVLGTFSCSNNDLIDGTSESLSLELSLTGIEPMQGQHYEGWVVGSGGVFSSGRFTTNSNNEVFSVDSSGQSLEQIGQNGVATFNYSKNAGTVSRFILTIEPNGDTDAGASAVHYVGGDFNNGVAVATVAHSGAIGSGFKQNSGSYILATPTNGPSTHNQGIWFLNSGAASLNLSTLNSGWAYEGWIVDTSTGEAISTGTFTSASGADSDGAGATAGSMGAPAFPGQDYINPARILNNGQHKVVISVEPSPDFDPAPFTLKILAHDIASGAPVESSISVDNISNEDNISITATLR